MITIGTKVSIMPGTDYGNRFVGQIGIVSINYNDKIGVRFDDRTNPNSEYGVFWFKETSLAVIPDRDTITEISVKQIIYSGPKTIIIWSDGSKTIVSCSKNDVYDRYAGFCAAVTKKIFGSNSNIKKVINQCTKNRPIDACKNKDNTSTWAEKEIELACTRERTNSSEEGEWEYGCACYESALRAYNSLFSDGHSGYSIGITKQILNRLIDGKPLTPIEDTPDVWCNVTDTHNNGVTRYQCKRMSSLFKYVYADGTIKYSDVNRCYCVNTDGIGPYHSGLVQEIVDELFPITMPYIPDKPFKVNCEEFLTDTKNGDFDTVGVLSIVKPNGKYVDVYRYFKEENRGFVPISYQEYINRKTKAENLRKKDIKHE